jgi:hypothetical protein
MTPDELPPNPPPRQSFVPWLAGCSGAALALVFVGVYFIMQQRNPWPEVTAESLAAAQQRWQAAKPADYRLRLKLVGPQSGEMVITVRDGQPTEVLRDGQPLRQSRTWSSWTVEGLMQMIRIDLDTANVEGKGSLSLTGEFDPVTGLPRHYRRVKFNPPLETGWDVEEWSTEIE